MNDDEISLIQILQSTEENRAIARARKNYIVLNNALVQRSRSMFNYQTNRLLAYVLSKIPSPIVTEDGVVVEKHDIPLDNEMYIQDYAKICNRVASGTFYNDTKKSMKLLRDNSIWIKTEDGGQITAAWLSRVQTHEKSEIPDNGKMIKIKGDGLIEYRFDEIMLPYMIYNGGGGGYSKYEFAEIMELPDKNESIPLFNLLNSYSYKKVFKISFDELRWLLCVDEKYYQEYKRFNNRILKPIIERINSTTSLNVRYEPVERPCKFIIFETTKLL